MGRRFDSVNRHHFILFTSSSVVYETCLTREHDRGEEACDQFADIQHGGYAPNGYKTVVQLINAANRYSEILLVRITLTGRSTGINLMVDELDIARIRAYAVRPALMPATRYTGHEQLTITNMEVVRLTLANGAEGIASCDAGWGRVEGGEVVRDIRDISTAVVGQNVRHRTSLTESYLADASEGPWEAISLIDCAMWDAYARSVEIGRAHV